MVAKAPFPDVSKSNWDTVLFLTPLGILKNYATADPVMRSFYSDFSKTTFSYSFWQILGLILVYAAILAHFFYLAHSWRQERDPK
jgi:hypothetical protein